MTRRIESIHAFLVEVNDEGDEGVAAYQVLKILEPMIATSDDKLEQLRGVAADLVARSGQRVRLVRFENRVDLEEVEGKAFEDLTTEPSS